MEKPVTSRSDPETRKAYSRWHYQQHKHLYKSRARKFTRANRQAVTEWLVEYLRTHPCVDCGERDIVVLDFDHEDPSAKSFDIGRATACGHSVASIEREVHKCQVRCANCHRRKTAKQNGWRKYFLQESLQA